MMHKLPFTLSIIREFLILIFFTIHKKKSGVYGRVSILLFGIG